MKKLLLAVTLVALIAAAVFGGQAIASNKPADVSVSEETSAIWGSYYWGSPVRMQTISGTVIVDDFQATETVSQTYPDTRNVHLTVVLIDKGLSDDGWCELGIMVDGLMSPQGYQYIDEIGLHTYEFDTTEWYLEVHPASASTTGIVYEATITYPR